MNVEMESRMVQVFLCFSKVRCFFNDNLQIGFQIYLINIYELLPIIQIFDKFNSFVNKIAFILRSSLFLLSSNFYVLYIFKIGITTDFEISFVVQGNISQIVFKHD